jgi:tripartite-type tricarboxylate transporter receptor subunit TctC
MEFPRRQILHLAAGAAALPAVSRVAWAQAYPSRPITLVVPLAPGGSTDVIGRIMAEGMRPLLGQPVIVENTAGAGGTIGVGRVARAAPDGYTIGIGHWGTHVVNAAIYPLQYDVFSDFAPVAWIATNPQSQAIPFVLHLFRRPKNIPVSSVFVPLTATVHSSVADSSRHRKSREKHVF